VLLIEPAAHVVGAAAFDLTEQALTAGQIGEPGVPPVGGLLEAAVVRVGGEPGPASADLVDTQIGDRSRWRVQERIGRLGECVVCGVPGDAVTGGDLRDGTPGFGHGMCAGLP